MTNLITSYLIQTGQCSIPGVGSFSFVHHPARHDVAAKEIFPPESEIQFSESTSPLSKELIHYISVKKQIEETEAVRAIQDWSKKLKSQLESYAVFSLPALGTLKKNDQDNIVFSPEEKRYFTEALPAIRVVHQEVNHAVLVGDKESNASEMSAILNGSPERKPKRSFWKIAAVILLAIGVGIIFYHFYTSDSINKLGNDNKINPAIPHETYISK